ncbi:hypothetical protein AC1031_019863 [Aphanomyces cochlioides]|nr:hypothetical protein AC1031_019863 [Aphanomyces cochlioides]
MPSKNATQGNARLSVTLSEMYEDASSPQQTTSLASGDPLVLWSKDALGIVIQYTAVGILLHSISSLGQAFFGSYLQVDPTLVQTYAVIVGFGWYLKVFFGVISDCFPLMGYRRKSYMILGWAITFVCMVVMAAIPFGDPYCRDTSLCQIPQDNLTSDELQRAFNFNAPSRGSPFIVLTLLLSFGYVMTVCASDALVLQYARREPIEIRGRTQCMVYGVREFAGAFAVVLVGVFLNGPSYQGSFSFEIKPNAMYGILCVPSGLALFNSIFLINEARSDNVPPRIYFQGLWELVQKRVTWQLCLFLMVINLFSNFNAGPAFQAAFVWANVTAWNYISLAIASSIVWSFAVFSVGRWGLQWNWRWLIGIAVLLSISLEALATLLIIWDRTRNEWIFTALLLFDSIPIALQFTVSFFCGAEISDIGNEGAVYGLLMTIQNIMPPFTSVFNSWLSSCFRADLSTDNSHARSQVTTLFAISCGIRLLSLLSLFLLPSQKRAVQNLKRYGGSNALAAGIVIAAVFACFAFAILANLLSIFPSTSCLWIAGGSGCP